MHKKRQEGEGGGGQPTLSWPRVIFSDLSGQQATQLYKPPAPPPPQLTCRKLNCTLVCTLRTVCIPLVVLSGQPQERGRLFFCTYLDFASKEEEEEG